MKVKCIMQEIRSLAKMDVILVPALLDKSLVRITPVAALIKTVIIMKETLSLAKMDAILVPAPLDKLPVRITPVAALM
jgi:hypothetical protein